MFTSNGNRRIPWYKKLAGLALGTVLSLLCLELTLWVMHGWYAPDSRALAQLAPKPGERRILCMGDSNTYGMNLTPEASYPGRLQSYLDAAPDNPWRVFNLGFPGQNTAQMRARLAANLEAYRPEILILWGGVNNTWSPAMGYLWEHPDGEPADAGEPLLDRSRALGALRMMFLQGRRITLEKNKGRRRRGPRPPGTFAIPGLAGAERGEGLGDVGSVPDGGQVRYEASDVRRGILVDLRRILAICKEHEVALVLGEYWADLDWIDERVNSAIAEFAAANGVPVVPQCDRMRALIDAYGSSLIQFQDYHATETGNREVARQVLLTLVREGLLEPASEWSSVPALEDMLLIEVTGRRGPLIEIRLRGEERALYQLSVHVLVAGAVGDEVATFTGKIDGQGAAYRRIDLSDSAAPGISGWRILAAYADTGDAVPATSVDVRYAQ